MGPTSDEGGMGRGREGWERKGTAGQGVSGSGRDGEKRAGIFVQGPPEFLVTATVQRQ